MRTAPNLMMAISWLALLGSASVTTKAAAVGDFVDHADIGAPKRAGDASYDAHLHRYTVNAGGANMFGAKDEFHFVWRKLKGDFVLRARVSFIGEGAEAHRKAGLMARSSLDAGAAYVDGVIHGQGPTALQVRRKQGADTEMMVTGTPSEMLDKLLGAAAEGTDYLQLERRGNTYIFSAAKWGRPYTQREVADIDLGGEIYVGLFLCAHNPDVIEKATFDDVHIKRMTTAARQAESRPRRRRW